MLYREWKIVLSASIFILTFASKVYSDVPGHSSYRELGPLEFKIYFEMDELFYRGAYQYSLTPKFENLVCDDGIISASINASAGEDHQFQISTLVKNLNITQFTSHRIYFSSDKKINKVSLNYQLEGCPGLEREDNVVFDL
jgi:hypothetical protein